SFLFFFHVPTSSALYPLSLHDALPIFLLHGVVVDIYGSEELASWLPLAGLTIFFVAQVNVLQYWFNRRSDYRTISLNRVHQTVRSEEHTSELQSRENLVCRLLLEKKKK